MNITWKEKELKNLDTVASDELVLFANNDSTTYFNSIIPVEKMLDKKIANGSFIPEKAVIAFNHVMEFAAKRYCSEFGGTWYKVFTTGTRKSAAIEMTENFINDRDI